VSVLLISGLSARDLGIDRDASSRLTLLAKPLDPAALSARLALLASDRDGAG
jgi:hypothetical protein